MAKNSPRLTLPVLAINSAARQDPAAVTRLTQAAERVKAAQLRGRSADLRSATDTFRTALAHMEERAVASLEGAGRRASAAMRTRIRQALAAAAADPRERAALRHGRLVREVAPAGFDVFDPATRALRLVHTTRPNPPASPAAASAASDDTRRQHARAQVRLRTAVAAARTKLRRLETRARSLDKTAARAAHAALTARQRGDAAHQAAEVAKVAVREAQTELAAAEEALRLAQLDPSS